MMQVKIVHNAREDFNAVTHSAPHHADEVLATAMLATFEDEVRLLRTRDRDLIKKIAADNAQKGIFIYDVGGTYDHDKKQYDHHQNDDSGKLHRPDGIKYSSAGLIWHHYSWLILKDFNLAPLVKDQVARIVNHKLIRGVDAHDNGQTISLYDNIIPVSEIIESFNVCWDEAGDDDEAFLNACRLAYDVLMRTIQNAISSATGLTVVETAIAKSDHHVMVMDQQVDGWKEAVLSSANIKAHEIFYVVFQGKAGHWNIQAVPPSLQDKWSQRKPFPESWRGLAGDDLAEATGVKTAFFCHPGGFFASTKAKEDAIIMAKLAVVTP